MSDQELIDGLRRGESEAWDVLFHRYLPLIWRFSYSRVGNIHVAEDIVSEVMLSLATRPPTIDRQRGTLAAWLLGVTRNKVADYFRLESRKRQFESQWRERQSEPVVFYSAHPLPLEFPPDVAQAVDRLSDEETSIVIWKYVDRLTVREIAQRLDKSEKSIESILYRARKSIRSANHPDSPASDKPQPTTESTDQPIHPNLRETSNELSE